VIDITLSKSEKEILQGFRNSPLKLVREKSTVILMRSAGVKNQQIIDVLGKTEKSIQRWCKSFTQIRLASIFSGHASNENAAKLTRQQKLEISEVLKQPVTEDSILPKRFWDVPELRKYISANFNVVYESKQSYHFLLKFSELSFKYP